MNKKILIVDDNNTIRNLFRIIIKNLSESIDCILANDGKAGFEQFKIHNPDLVVVDLWMPHMDGIELIQKIRELNKIVPVICISQQAEDYDISQAIEQGANEFIPKGEDSTKQLQKKFQSYLT